MTSRAAGTVNLLAFRRVGVSRALSVDPFPGIHRILLVRTGRGYAGNLGNPVFAQEFVRIAVPFGELAYIGIVQCGEPAVTNDRVFLATLGRDRKSRKQQVNMQMVVKDAILAGPFFLSGTPQRAEAHVNYTGAAPLPLKTVGRVFFNAVRPYTSFSCPNRQLSGEEPAGTREVGRVG